MRFGVKRSQLTSSACQAKLGRVIRNFRHRGLKRLWEGDSSRVSADLRERLENILSVLDAAASARDLDLPGYRLHRLKGDLKGLWSITVSGNWRVTFRIQDGAVLDVDLTDYH
jgi:toxin HigB-1